MGESGSGKTTTLKMINRLIEPTTGSIQFKGQDITIYPLRELRWQIGYVLQQIALFPNMTVGQNIALIPELRHMPKNQVIKRVDELLDSVACRLLNTATVCPKPYLVGNNSASAFCGRLPISRQWS